NKEIIVVDSESSDKTLEIAKEYADKIIVKNCIMPRGRNIGAREANGNVLCFLDADTILCKDWVEKALSYLYDKRVIAVYGDLFPIEENLKAKLVYSLQDFCNFAARIVGMPIFSKLGTAVAIKRNFFEKVGGYPEDKASCEDIRLSLKLRKYGKIKFTKDLKGLVSMRRFERVGYLKLSLIWLFTGIYTMLTEKPLLNTYSRDFP
ncbi:MAG: glycosyltransferase, partial [Candidatus Aenigmatarchaeota archaeon]